MYNQELNDRCLCLLKDYCKDKKVILVGNSVSLLNEDYGKFIDSYDVVVRIGKGVPLKRYQKNVGSRTDVWMTASFRASMYDSFKDAKFKILNFIQSGFYHPNAPTVNFPTEILGEDFQIYRDYLLAGSAKEQKALCEKVYPKAQGNNWRTSPRISQGMFAILFFQDVVKTYGTLDIIGFDFFESKLRYKLKDGKEDDEKEVSSWHVPLPAPNTVMPHSPKLEKQFTKARVADKMYRTNLFNMNTSISKQLHDSIITDLRHDAEPLPQTNETFPDEIVLWISNSCPACHIIMEKLEDEGVPYRHKMLGIDYSVEDIIEKIGIVRTPSIFDVNDNYLGDGKFLQKWVYWKKGII